MYGFPEKEPKTSKKHTRVGDNQVRHKNNLLKSFHEVKQKMKFSQNAHANQNINSIHLKPKDGKSQNLNPKRESRLDLKGLYCRF